MTEGAPILPPKMRASSIRVGRGIDTRGIIYTLEERVAGTPPASEGNILVGSWSGTPTLEQLVVGNWSQGTPTASDLEVTTWSDL